MRRLRQFGLAVVFGLLSFGATPGEAATIEFTATDLADAVPGDDLWRLEYQISDIVFNQFEAFSIYFDPARYGALDNPSTTNADWSLLVLQPDVVFGTPVDGLFIGQALTTGASTAAPFLLDVVLLGGGTPGAQPFDVSAFDADGNFIDIVAVGRTRQPGTAPEPASLLLFGTALGALVKRRLNRGARS